MPSQRHAQITTAAAPRAGPTSQTASVNGPVANVRVQAGGTSPKNMDHLIGCHPGALGHFLIYFI